MKQSKLILPIIFISQFCCTSLWFACNGVMPDLVSNFNLSNAALGHLTSAVQFGFITGTLVYAALTIADRFSPSKVFLVSALLGALFNLGMIWDSNTLMSLLAFRFLAGFFLAGIYPIGMKIAADYYNEGLGKSLGFLVGALVVGTALPHLLSGLGDTFAWQSVFLFTSSLATFGGLLMVMMIPDGPYRKPNQHIDLSAFFGVFKNRNFRAAAFGYFGHMWELYAFWAFVPVLLQKYSDLYPTVTFNIPVLSFCIIAIGGVACVLGGFLSEKIGAKRTAFIALLLSCSCCLLCPLLFTVAYANVFLAFMFFWGMVVIADSPLFSTLVAHNATPELKGTALTIVNCIGFSITIISIQLLSWLSRMTDANGIYMVLAVGPVLGLMALRR